MITFLTSANRSARIVLAAVILLSFTPPSRAADELIYKSPSGIGFHVTSGGLSSIALGDRELATGGWSAFNAESWFKDGGSQIVKSDPKGPTSIEIVDDHHARVRQTGGDLICTFDYTFDGEDVLISAHIENNNADAPINIVGFSGLTFRFDKPPAGLMPVQNITYFQVNGVQLCHPSSWQQIGGTYAEDNSIGVGTSPWNIGLIRTLTLWDYADWNADKQANFPQRILRYFVVSPVPPRGSATFDFSLRISPDRDWKHLLEKYREHFQKTFGPVQYKLDARFIGTDYLNGGAPSISPTNPYGFRPGPRRIDTLMGAQTFCNSTIPALKQANGQGIIVWGQTGEDPRGGMYRPDFDVLPPEVEENWQSIAGRFKAAGLKLGVATRPRDMAVKLDWKTDQIIPINPDDPAHRDMLWRRFSNMLSRGCTLFYLDSFGDSFEDVKLMKSLRQKLGPSILTFSEHQSDAMLPYSGGYSETSFTDGSDGKPAGYRLWSGEQNWQIYQWLCPGAQMAGRLFETHGKIPSPNAPDEWYFTRHITPLIPTDNFRVRLWDMKKLQDQYVMPNGQWR